MSTIVWRLLRRCGLAVALVSLVACANLTDITSELGKKPACCTGVHQFSYAAMSTTGPTPIQLGPQSPVFDFDVGKSYFSALELPPNSAGRMLQFYAMATGSTAFETSTLAQIFCPRVLFLDADKRTISADDQVPSFDIFTDFGALMRGAGAQFPVPDAARYVVVHSNPARFGQLVYRYSRPSGYMVGQTFVFGQGEAFPFPCAPVADALVRLR